MDETRWPCQDFSDWSARGLPLSFQEDADQAISRTPAFRVQVQNGARSKNHIEHRVRH